MLPFLLVLVFILIVLALIVQSAAEVRPGHGLLSEGLGPTDHVGRKNALKLLVVYDLIVGLRRRRRSCRHLGLPLVLGGASEAARGWITSLNSLLIVERADMLLDVREVFAGVLHQALGQQRALLQVGLLLFPSCESRLVTTVARIGVAGHLVLAQELLVNSRAVVLRVDPGRVESRSNVVDVLRSNIFRELPLIVLDLLGIILTA